MISPTTTPGTGPEDMQTPAGDNRVICSKCGAELRSQQKVCIKCGTRTVAGGNFDYGEKEPFQITRNMKRAAAGVALLLVIILIARFLQVTPPDVVAQRWFDAMSQRELNAANAFHSPDFTAKMQPAVSDTTAISDFIYDEINSKQAKPTVGKPVIDGGGTQATVTISLSYPDGGARTIDVVFAKIGRRWLINDLRY